MPEGRGNHEHTGLFSNWEVQRGGAPLEGPQRASNATTDSNRLTQQTREDSTWQPRQIRSWS